MRSHTKPIIGLPCGKSINKAGVAGYDLKEPYVSALVKSGALPLLIPIDLPLDSLNSLLEYFDGFLLSGGADVDPAIFGGEAHEKVYGVNQQRDAFEIALVKALLTHQRPLLTICRGTQVLNVALGGTLFTDIGGQVPKARKHDWFPRYPRDRIAHHVRLETGSRLQEILGGDEIATNSLHHQSIKEVGKGLKINAFAPDGIVEGIELREHAFMIGVQWHPEWLQTDMRTMRLFEAFVDACRQG
jgi:putative glutamine amidotransferase